MVVLNKIDLPEVRDKMEELKVGKWRSSGRPLCVQNGDRQKRSTLINQFNTTALTKTNG